MESEDIVFATKFLGERVFFENFSDVGGIGYLGRMFDTDKDLNDLLRQVDAIGRWDAFFLYVCQAYAVSEPRIKNSHGAFAWLISNPDRSCGLVIKFLKESKLNMSYPNLDIVGTDLEGRN